MEQKPINIFNLNQNEALTEASRNYLLGKKIVRVSYHFIEFEGGIVIMLDDETISEINYATED